MYISWAKEVNECDAPVLNDLNAELDCARLLSYSIFM